MSSGIRDNHVRGKVAEFLEQNIQANAKLSVVSAYFTIYAYDALKNALNKISHLDFLFGEPSFINRLDPEKTDSKQFLLKRDGLELANQLQLKRIAKECADWIDGSPSTDAGQLVLTKSFIIANIKDNFGVE